MQHTEKSYYPSWMNNSNTKMPSQLTSTAKHTQEHEKSQFLEKENQAKYK